MVVVDLVLVQLRFCKALNIPKDIQFVEQDSYNVQEGAKAEVRYKAESKFTAEQDAQRMDEDCNKI